MVEYVGISVCWYVVYIPTFPCFYILNYLRNSAYPSSYGSTGFIESITSRISSLSNRNTNNTRSVTLLKPISKPLTVLLMPI